MRLAILAATALALALAACASASSTTTATTETTPAMNAEDPYLWLEDVEGERALTWVREQNARSLPQLENDPRFPQLLADATALANSRDRLPLGGIFDGYYYNFWQDEAHVRGIYRRARLTDFARNGNPTWETVLDIDAIATAENANWVFKGIDCLEDTTLCLVALSDGGKDASDTPPPVLSRLPFPESWRMLLVLDRARQGISGEAELAAFRRLPPFPAETAAHLCRLALMRFLPGVALVDLAAAGSALGEIQRLVGDHFAPVQEGRRFVSEGVTAALAALAEDGIEAADVGEVLRGTGRLWVTEPSGEVSHFDTVLPDPYWAAYARALHENWR